MAQAEFHEVLPVDRDKLFGAITGYESYPQFVDGVKSVQVERKAPGQAHVTYHISMLKDVIYTLDIREDAASGVIHWRLVESDTFKLNNGRWELRAAGPGKTDVLYRLEIEFKIPVPSFVLGRLIKGSLPTMIRNFQERAQAGR